MSRVTLLYFASLRDAAGLGSEVVETAAVDLQALYLEAQARHDLPLPRERLRVAVDGAFAHWEGGVPDGSQIAFIPPVSGG